MSCASAPDLNCIEKDILFAVLIIMYRRAVDNVRDVLNHNEHATFHHDILVNCVRCTVMFEKNMKYFKNYWQVVVSGRPLSEPTPIDDEVTDTLSFIKYIRQKYAEKSQSLDNSKEEDIYEILIFMTILCGIHTDLDILDEVNKFFDDNTEYDEEDEEEEEDDDEDNLNSISCSCKTCFRCLHAEEFWTNFQPEDEVGMLIRRLLS
jgi:hypothetical protein